MARVTYVKHAQQRYETTPVLDELEGGQKKVPVMRRDGTQKTTKTGRLVFQRQSVRNLSRPLPNRKCGKCGNEIKVGDPYKWIKPKSGPYGGRLMVRCGTCPVWHRWEYSSSLDARLEQVSYEFSNELDDVEDPDGVTAALSTAAEQVREIAQEKNDSAQNIEDGFGHPTSMSEELQETAQSLESWADEIESADVPDLPELEETECEECGGTGKDEGINADCEVCEGTGSITPEELTDDQIEEWRDEVRNSVTIVDEQPF